MGKQQELRRQRQEKRKEREKTHVSLKGLPEFNRETTHHTYAELVKSAKKNVFLIARFRQDDGDQGHITTLGTGFLIGNGRMLTCSHVMNNQEEGGEPHQDGDLYIFIMRTEDNQLHQSAPVALRLDKTLFDYPETDAAVIYLPRDFYFDGDDRMIHHPEDHLILAKNPYDIGTDIGVLGYPMQSISIAPSGQMDLSSVYIRGDKGIVNTRYKKNKVFFYEFTVAFNPGNSGGPIFNIETGEVIAMVHAYRSVPIKFAKDAVPDALKADVGSDDVISVVRSTYSLGLASENYRKLKDEHDICFDN